MSVCLCVRACGRVRVCVRLSVSGRLFWRACVCGCMRVYRTVFKQKVSSYTAQYPFLRTARSALNFTFMADLFN